MIRALAVVVISMVAILAQASDTDLCSGKSPGAEDARIAACTRAIGVSSASLVAMLGHRGIAWAGKGAYDQAITDFSEALRIDPRDALSYLNRGLARAQKRDYDRAIADFDEALRLDPQNANARKNREVALKMKRG
jgi:tetratricopeptide (TPR) repeat protein